MKNLNHKGFALVETLVVSTFVVGIFTLLYTNYYPLMGEYEKREEYDAIDSVYKTDLVKRMIMRNPLKSNPYSSLKNNKNYIYYDKDIYFCSFFNDVSSCQNLWKQANIKSILFTNYTLINVKNEIKNSNTISESLKEYVDYLPKYSTNKYNYKGRIIVEYEEEIDTESNPYKVSKYATLGVDLYD